MLVGLLPDEKSEREVSTEEGKEIATSKNLNGFMECNVRTGENIKKLFENLTSLVLNKKKDNKILEKKLLKSKRRSKMKDYEEFMVYRLERTGDHTKLNITPEELQNYLNPEQVLIILRKDLERIFIWKGVNSHVGEKFIASRVAADLQSDLDNKGHFHRCKIISVDQGDEPTEFLDAFGLDSMKIKGRYVGNIERDRLLEQERLVRLFLEGFRDLPDNDKNTIIQSLKDEEASEKSDRDDDGDKQYPYPYNFKPPGPPDDFAIRSQFLEKVSNKGDMNRLLDGFQIPEEVKKEEQPRLSDEEIRIIDLESVEGVKLIKQYQEETKRTALWKGKETNDFTKWLKGEKVEKLDQTVIDLISIYLEDFEIVLKSWETKYEMDNILHSLARFMLVYDIDYRLEFENFIERIKKWLDYDGNKYPYSEILKIVHGDDEYRQQFLPKRRRNFKDRERYPYPYVFKPPSPPDDLALAPREQFRSSSNKKDREEDIHCQYCGIKLTKEEEITHTCKKKPKTS